MSRIIPTVDADLLTEKNGSRSAYLTQWPVLGWLLRRGYLMTGLRLLTLALLVLAIVTGLMTEDARVGLSVLLMWGIFWPLLTSVVTPTLGNAFCAICPHGFVGKWLSRIGLRRPFPKSMRGVWAGLIILVLGYWVISFAMPGTLSGSTRTTAWYFLGFTMAAFAVFFVYKDMAWCKHLCPLGRVLATHGRAGVLKITTDQQACQSCTSFECAKSCSYHLSPFRFERTNNQSSCTLCSDCVTACNSVDLVARSPASGFSRVIEGQHRHEMWVYLVILAVAGVGIQFLHGLQHTPLKDYLPWHLAGAQLHAWLPIAQTDFDLGRFLALVAAVVLTLAVGFLGYRKVAQLTGKSWKEAANTLACGLAPLAVIGLIPHAMTRFTTTNAPALVNETGALLGLGWQMAPLAQRGDAWLGWMGLLPYLAMVWTLWLIWQRAGVLTGKGRLRWVVWVYGSAPAWLYISVFAIKLLAVMIMPAGVHHH